MSASAGNVYQAHGHLQRLGFGRCFVPIPPQYLDFIEPVAQQASASCLTQRYEGVTPYTCSVCTYRQNELLPVPNAHHVIIIASKVFQLEIKLGDRTPEDLVHFDENGTTQFDRFETILAIWEDGGASYVWGLL